MLVEARKVNQDLKQKLINNGVDKKLASILGARVIDSAHDLDYNLKNLLPPQSLLNINEAALFLYCLLYTSPSPRDVEESRMPSSA